MINFKVRLRNPVFIAQIILSILTPILAYKGLSLPDLNSWSALGQVIWGSISNPYILGLIAVSVWNAVNDPTTAGLADSERAMLYVVPKERG